MIPVCVVRIEPEAMETSMPTDASPELIRAVAASVLRYAARRGVDLDEVRSLADSTRVAVTYSDAPAPVVLVGGAG